MKRLFVCAVLIALLNPALAGAAQKGNRQVWLFLTWHDAIRTWATARPGLSLLSRPSWAE